jgi:hypothetical protein
MTRSDLLFLVCLKRVAGTAGSVPEGDLFYSGAGPPDLHDSDEAVALNVLDRRSSG